jgi:CubicO group peptidase (beta-lactamase class C family)
MRNTIRCPSFLATIVLAFWTSSAPAVTREKVAAALPELEKVVEQMRKQTGVPGVAIAVVHKDEVVYLKGFGVRKAGQPDPIETETVFQLASVSKPIATTVIAALVGEGKIGWDDRITDHDPGFQLYDPWVTRELTFRDLLCHRSGLPDHAGDLLEDLGYDRTKVLHRLRYLKCGDKFRSQYAYTNFGFTEAGVAAARAAATTWEDLAQDKLFEPLGMTSTSSRYADYKSAPNRALLHVRVDGKWTAKNVREPDAQSPAGGVSSTIRDMSHWLRLQLAEGKFDGKQVIAANALNETHRPQIVSRPVANPATDQAGFYGLGWNVSYNDQGRVFLGHSGAFDLGAATVVNMLPSEDLGIVVLTNAAPIGVAEAIAASYLNLAMEGKVQRDWLSFFGGLVEETEEPQSDKSSPAADDSPALAAKAYVGKYTNVYYGDLEVVEQDKKLALLMGPKKMRFPLRHADRDDFIYQPTGEMASGESALSFQMGTDGRASAVNLEYLDAQGQGRFIREAPGE